MLNEHAQKYDANRSVAVDAMISRYGLLIETTDLSSITCETLTILCQVLQGTATSSLVDAKSALRAEILAAVEQTRDYKELFERAVEDGRIDASPDEVAAHLKENDTETTKIQNLASMLKELSPIQCTALLERVEEVIGGNGEDMTARCRQVYEKMRGGSKAGVRRRGLA